MTASSMQGPRRPGAKIRHSWRCTRKAATVEMLKPSPTGQCFVTEQCSECGHDDLTDRMERQARQDPRVPSTQAANMKGLTAVTATSMQGPLGRRPDPRIKHRTGCGQRGPYTRTETTTASGERVRFNRCEECLRTDADAALLDRLLPDDAPDAA